MKRATEKYYALRLIGDRHPLSTDYDEETQLRLAHEHSLHREKVEMVEVTIRVLNPKTS